MSTWKHYPIRLPAVILLIGAAFSVLFGVNTDTENKLHAEAAFQALTNRALLQLDKRMELYRLGLVATQGAVSAAGGEQLTHRQFMKYAQPHDFFNEYPGVRGFGFIKRFTHDQENALLTFGRQDIHPDFSIREISPNPADRFVILFVEPEEKNRQAIGLDIGSEPLRRAAAIESAKTGKATLTQPITLVQADEKTGNGFLFLSPLYSENMPLNTEEERMQAVYGWVYTPIVFDEIMKEFDFREGEFALRITDISTGYRANGQNYFYKSHDADQEAVLGLQRNIPFNAGQRQWLLEIKALPRFQQSLNLTPAWLVTTELFLVSTLASGLLYFTLLSVQRSTQVESELKQQEKLRDILEEKERLSVVTENSPDLIIMADLDGKIIYQNIAAARMMLKNNKNVQHLYELFPDWIAKLLDVVAIPAAIKQGIWEGDTAIVNQAGQIIPVSQTILVQRDKQGGVTTLSTILRDISDRFQREEKLRELTAFQKAILDSAGYSVIATSPDGLITLFNPAAEKMLGYRADEMTGKETPALLHDLDEMIDRAHSLST
ncbi:MAG TPA: CHASE domain-containing protein, partial [Pseudomonadales bacterium]|nr:CHASE domain-containing protein [Pseudomonadales bacterium]